MHREDNSKFLLYIELDKDMKSFEPLEDELVEMMEKALKKAKRGTAGYSHLDNDGSNFREGSGYKGSHVTDCGERSSNTDYLLENGMITNSLAAFYLRWYRDYIPASEMEKVMALKEFYSKSETVKNVFIQASTAKDIENIWIDIKKKEEEEEEQYQKTLKDEAERVENIECPCCKSIEKVRHMQFEGNGIYGPGSHSRTVSDYYVCKCCGVHYDDVNKKEIKEPQRIIYNRIFP